MCWCDQALDELEVVAALGAAPRAAAPRAAGRGRAASGLRASSSLISAPAASGPSLLEHQREQRVQQVERRILRLVAAQQADALRACRRACGTRRRSARRRAPGTPGSAISIRFQASIAVGRRRPAARRASPAAALARAQPRWSASAASSCAAPPSRSRRCSSAACASSQWYCAISLCTAAWRAPPSAASPRSPSASPSLSRRSRAGGRAPRARTACRRACVNSSSARSSRPGAMEVLRELVASRSSRLLGRQVGAVEQVLVHADRAVDLALPAEQAPSAKCSSIVCGSTLTTSMNASIALSGCSFSRKLRPRKYDSGSARDSRSRCLMSMRAAIQPSAKNTAGIGSSHQSSNSIGESRQPSSTASLEARARRRRGARARRRAARQRVRGARAARAAAWSAAACRRAARSAPASKPGRDAARERDEHDEDQRRLATSRR